MAAAITLWLGSNTGGASLHQLLADRIIELTPTWLFRDVLLQLEANTRPLALLMLTLAIMCAGAVAGAAYARKWPRSDLSGRLLGAVALASGSLLLLALVISPAAGAGLFARSTDEPAATMAIFAVASTAFAMMAILTIPFPRAEEQFSASRRGLLHKAASVAMLALPAIVAAGYIGNHLQRMRGTYQPGLAFQSGRTGTDFALEGMPHEITPTEAFYVVSKNFVDPQVDSSGWSLEIGGLVERPLTLSYTDMLLPESQEFVATLECISNEVGGPYIGNAVWQGFPLSVLLERSGLRPGIIDLEIHAADGYIESLPIEKAMDDVMVVHTMNGEPLTYEHGYPVRLIVPGRYGKKNVKWVTALSAVPEDIKGYWQIRGWSDTAFILTMSRIDLPENGHKVQVGETLRAGGVAFGGERGIDRVEVSFDRGESWEEARLSSPLSGNAWRLWRADYIATEPGIKRIIVRATDGTGEVQERAFVEPLPEGSTGWHERWFEVLEA